MKEKLNSILDKSRQMLSAAKSRMKLFKEKISTAINGAPEQTDENADKEEESESNKEEKTEQAANNGGLSLLFFLAILDTIASLVFIAAIVLAIKPALLKGSVNSDTYEFSSVVRQIGNVFLRIEFTKYKDNNLRISVSPGFREAWIYCACGDCRLHCASLCAGQRTHSRLANNY